MLRQTQENRERSSLRKKERARAFRRNSCFFRFPEDQQKKATSCCSSRDISSEKKCLSPGKDLDLFLSFPRTVTGDGVKGVYSGC